MVAMAHGHNPKTEKPPLLLILVDGLRHDYPELMRRYDQSLPAFERLFKGGARSSRHRSIYPSVTFPNHQAIQTGLYGEFSGIVDNFVAVPDRGNYLMKNQTSLNRPDLVAGLPDPLWVTNQRQGGRSGVVLYPVTDASFNGVRPFVQVRGYWILNGFPAYYPLLQRVEDILLWLGDSRYQVNYAVLYFDEPDESAHIFGIGSKEMQESLLGVDHALSVLLDGLEARDLLDKTNIILVGDHGMSDYNCSENMFSVTDHLQGSGLDFDEFVSECTNTLVLAKPGKLHQLFYALVNSSKHVRFYLKEDFIQRFPHYHTANTNRSEGVFYETDLPYVVSCHKKSNKTCFHASKATHGWNYNEPDMWPLLVGHGPAFRQNFHLKAEEPLRRQLGVSSQVDLYPLMCYLMGIHCPQRNGSLMRLENLLRPEARLLSVEKLDHTARLRDMIFLLTMGGLCALISIVMVCSSVLMYKRKRHLCRGRSHRLLNAGVIHDSESARQLLMEADNESL